MGAVTSSHIKGLEESFQTFNKLSESLETSYYSLQDCVAQLQGDLLSEKMQEQNNRLRLLSNVLKVLPAGVLVLDSSGRVQECNDAALQLLSGPLKGELWIDVVNRSFAPQHDDGHEVSLHDGRRVSVSTCPLGDVPGQVLLLTDVTHTRTLQERLSQQKRLTALGEMAASLAHQIRTPLSATILGISQLKNNKLEGNKRNGIIDKLLANIRQLESLVTDMLLFSRSGYTGEEPFTINSLIDALHKTFDIHSHGPQIRYQVSGQVNHVSIIGNKNILHSALLNLINNAFDSQAGKGEVQVHVYSHGLNTVDIKIQDSGCGVPEEIKEKIFDPFFTTRPNGTGLGLAVVRAIARAHRGEVWLDSKTQNGSAFIMRLPTID